jgi:hypothetical protein
MEATLRDGHLNCDDDLLDRILASVADRDGTDLFDLPPVYEAVEPDALAALARGSGVDVVSFTYHGYEVVVEDGDHVHVRERQA